MKGKKLYLQTQAISDKLYEYPNILGKEEKHILYKEYVRILRKAAYAGNAQAQFELGLKYEDIYYYGKNPNYNPKKCFYWYSKACKGNIADACNNLASLYEEGIGCQKNIEMALSLYKKAKDLGCIVGKGNYKLLLKQINSEKVNKKE